MLRKTIAIAGLLAASATAACDPTPAGEAGVETGPCIAGGCFDGLECLSDLCVDPDQTGGSDDDDSPADDDNSASSASSVSGATDSGPDDSGPDDSGPDDSGPDDSGPDDSGPDDSGPDDSGPDDSGPDDSGPDDTGPDDTGPDDSGGGPGLDDPCDLWDQDCEDGLKCNPWADDGGNSWNASKCVDLDNSPGAPGESCTVVGNGVSGEDDCELGAMCFGVDPETNVGECIELCAGSEAAPVCGVAGESCIISNDGFLPLCRGVCDPLAQTCGAGNACYAVGETFVCSPDASGEQGIEGDACAYVNVCDPGLMCVAGELAPGCFGAGCCQPFCNMDDADPGCSAETECAAVFPGAGPVGFEHVGVCILPE